SRRCLPSGPCCISCSAPGPPSAKSPSNQRAGEPAPRLFFPGPWPPLAMSSGSDSSFLDAPDIRRRDWFTILLIGIARGPPHFFPVVLPPLSVSLGAAFDPGFARLGLLVSTFCVVSVIGQASSGFVVDRIGARPVLWFGLSCFVLSGIMIGSANGYAMLLMAAAIGGVGNSVFHSVDYSIMNHRVRA